MKKIFLILMLVISSITLYAQGNKEKFKTEDAVAFSKTISRENVVVIDVRSAAECKTGRLPKSVNIDMQDPEFIPKVLKISKGKVVAVYCRNGAKSKVAAMKLSYKGVEVVLLDKGIAEWKGKLVK